MSGNEPPPESSAAVGQHARPPRKNLLLAATIEAGALSAPVRIRNLSETGATVVWRAAGRCGIRFAGVVCVDDWAIGKRRAASLFEHSQAGVDARQAAIRSGASLPADDCAAMTAPPRADILEGRIAEELAYLRRVLDSVGDTLSDDAIILQRHGGALQQIDATCQILAELAAILGSRDRVAAAVAVNMHDLRARLLRK